MIVYDKYLLDSNREIDANGYLRVNSNNITKTQIRPYLGREIPDWRSFNLDPNKIYNVLCSNDELEKAAPTFNNLPLTREHIEVFADDVPKDKIVGSLGDHASFEAPYLKNSLIIYDQKDIDLVMSGKKRELSCGYRYTPVRESGEFEGQHYDFKMTNIIGNHVAIVKKGRAGRDVMVADSSKSILDVIKEKILAVFDSELVADADEQKEEDVEWITVKGNHIPVKKGQSKEEAVNSFIESKKESSKTESKEKSDGEKVKEFIEIAKGKSRGEPDKEWLSNKIKEEANENGNKKLISFLKNEADIREGDSFEWKGNEYNLVDIDMSEETATLEDDNGSRKTVDLESLVKANYEEEYDLYENEEDGIKIEKITEKEARKVWEGHYLDQKFKKFDSFEDWYKDVQKFDNLYDWYDKAGNQTGDDLTKDSDVATINNEELPVEAGKPEVVGDEKTTQKGETEMAEEVKEVKKEEEKKPETPAKVEKEKPAEADKVTEDSCSKDSEPAKKDEEKKETSEEKVVEDKSEEDKKEDKKEEKKEEIAEDKCGKMAKDSEMVMDADAIRAEGRKEAMEDYKARDCARKEVRHIVGDVDVFAFDSAEGIYKFACEKAGMNLNEIASYKDAFKGLSAGKSKLAMDASPVSGSNEECFKDIRVD